MMTNVHFDNCINGIFMEEGKEIVKILFPLKMTSCVRKFAFSFRRCLVDK